MSNQTLDDWKEIFNLQFQGQKRHKIAISSLHIVINGGFQRYPKTEDITHRQSTATVVKILETCIKCPFCSRTRKWERLMAHGGQMEAVEVISDACGSNGSRSKEASSTWRLISEGVKNCLFVSQTSRSFKRGKSLGACLWQRWSSSIGTRSSCSGARSDSSGVWRSL